MCGKVLVTLLLLVIPYGVPALATAFLSYAGQHVRKPFGRRRPAQCTRQRSVHGTLSLGCEPSGRFIKSTASHGRRTRHRLKSSWLGLTLLRTSLATVTIDEINASSSTRATLCDQCGEVTATLGLTICAAPGCGVKFAQCSKCEADYDGCCSLACQALAAGMTQGSDDPWGYNARWPRHSIRRPELSGLPPPRDGRHATREQDYTSADESHCLGDQGPSSAAVSTSTRHEARFVVTERGESKDSDGGDDASKGDTRAVLEGYASRHSAPESAALASVRKETNREQPRGAHMMSGHLQGELLKLLTRLCGAKKVLDIGTFTGYSALAFAEALPEDGMVVTLESDERAADTARRHFADSDHGGKIRLLLGQAIDTIDQLIAEDVWQFDVIFIDADKKRYWDYYNKVLKGPRPLLAAGGVLLADNVLFHDMVPLVEAEGVENASEGNPKLSAAEVSTSTNESTGGGNGEALFLPTPRRLKIAGSLDEFNKRVLGDDRVEVLLLPLRDGLSVIRWREGRKVSQSS